MDLHIAGNAAVVTASSSGLGKASARALAAEGVDVVVNGRDEDRLAEAVEDIRADATGSVVGQQGDIAVREDIESVVQRCVDEFGRLDHLVTSAGGPASKSTLETTDEDWYDAFDMLVMSVVRAVRAGESHLRADGGGSIVNITSMSVKEPSSTLVLSASVRMAVAGLEKTLSRELAPDVRSNMVLPRSIETERIRSLGEAAIERGEYESYDEVLAERAGDSPLGRLGRPDELGDLVAFLCSDRASYLNGTAISVDGGVSKSTL
ncbi:SDR family oxidoreductase [Halorubrum sp. HHNYT27]|uniref:SDR family oxidoreductase n=1 Tax=Halorubrum sp. HHNYT27 TaxID=3402275 RepID=UPI003EBE5566